MLVRELYCFWGFLLIRGWCCARSQFSFHVFTRGRPWTSWSHTWHPLPPHACFRCERVPLKSGACYLASSDCEDISFYLLCLKFFGMMLGNLENSWLWLIEFEPEVLQTWNEISFWDGARPSFPALHTIQTLWNGI